MGNTGEATDTDMLAPDCSHPRLLGQSMFRCYLRPGYFLFQSYNSMLET